MTAAALARTGMWLTLGAWVVAAASFFLPELIWNPKASELDEALDQTFVFLGVACLLCVGGIVLARLARQAPGGTDEHIRRRTRRTVTGALLGLVWTAAIGFLAMLGTGLAMAGA